MCWIMKDGALESYLGQCLTCEGCCALVHRMTNVTYCFFSTPWQALFNANSTHCTMLYIRRKRGSYADDVLETSLVFIRKLVFLTHNGILSGDCLPFGSLSSPSVSISPLVPGEPRRPLRICSFSISIPSADQAPCPREQLHQSERLADYVINARI